MKKNASGKTKASLKIWLFRLISISMPFVLVILLELTLRLFNVSPSVKLFIDVPGSKDYKVFNPHFSKPYFVNTQNAITGFYEPFKKTRDPNTFRVFVQGASTCVGFPYFNNGSFHRMLKYRLEQSYPDANVEIINVSLTAINSVTLADQVDEIIACNPDAVLIYAGHNEYYGAMGIASTKKIWNNPFVTRLLIQFNKLHIVQFIRSVIFSGENEERDMKDQNLMQEMARNSKIAYGSKDYQNGIEQFSANLDRILKTYQKNNVPVFISTIGSNIKDLAPFISIAEHGDSAQLANTITKTEELLGNSDTVKARDLLFEALKTDSTFAKTHFLLGKICLSENDTTLAKRHFVKAKQFDALRFRAPEEINKIIADKASEFEAVLVDSKSALEASTKQNIIGDDLMLEHVHPNLNGYSLIADAFYNSLFENCKVNGSANYISYSRFKNEMPLTVVDSLRGYYATIIMKEKWPFHEPKTQNIFGNTKSEVEEIAGMLVINQITWDEAMEMLYKHYRSQGETKKTMKVAEATVLEHPMNVELIAKSAQLFAKEGDYQKAVFYYRKAFLRNQSPFFARKIAQNLLQINELDMAKQYLEYSSANDIADRISQQAITAINQIKNIENNISNSEEAAHLYITLAANYLKLGIKNKAYESFLVAKSLEPNNVLIKDMETRIFNTRHE